MNISLGSPRVKMQSACDLFRPGYIRCLTLYKEPDDQDKRKDAHCWQEGKPHFDTEYHH